MGMGQDTFEVYVKNTSNCQQAPLTTFRSLSPVYDANKVQVYFHQGPDGDPEWLTVVGWTDLFFGEPCSLSIQWVEHYDERGVLVSGGNSGVRILDERFEPTEGVDDHLPRGMGLPWIWINEGDVERDLPDAVLAVIGKAP